MFLRACSFSVLYSPKTDRNDLSIKFWSAIFLLFLEPKQNNFFPLTQEMSSNQHYTHYMLVYYVLHTGCTNIPTFGDRHFRGARFLCHQAMFLPFAYKSWSSLIKSPATARLTRLSERGSRGSRITHHFRRIELTPPGNVLKAENRSLDYTWYTA
jgi:hypothetical protein